jgi:hypothetical protein
MPLTEPVSFKARVQRYNRVQIPVLIKWEHKLESDQVLEVQLNFSGKGFYRRESFYARMSKDGRLTIPKLIVQELSEGGSLEGKVAKITLYPPGWEEE